MDIVQSDDCETHDEPIRQQVITILRVAARGGAICLCLIAGSYLQQQFALPVPGHVVGLLLLVANETLLQTSL